MLTIVLRILSILGILFLALLALAVTILLLVLFVPVTYRISGAKDEEGFRIRVKIKWLLGFFGLRYGYPEPGELTAKILFFTLYRMKIPPDAAEDDSGKADSEESKRKKIPAGDAEKTAAGAGAGTSGSNESKAAARRETSGRENPSMKTAAEQTREEDRSVKTAAEQTMKEDRSVDAAAEQTMEEGQSVDAAAEQTMEEGQSVDAAAEETAEENLSGIGKILQKFRKIQYTIHSIYDKIKEIWNNISYYLELLQEEETRQLFSHIRLRTGKIIKSVWPGHIRAEILFGTGSPDTTGYLYGVYCMLSSMLRAGVCVTPDFEEAVLKADFDISGHIALWVLAVNACRIALDKRLRRLIRKAVKPGIKAVGKKAA